MDSPTMIVHREGGIRKPYAFKVPTYTTKKRTAPTFGKHKPFKPLYKCV